MHVRISTLLLCKFLTRKNSEVDKFLVIHQNFRYQIFLLALANVVPATVHQCFFLSKNCIYHTVFVSCKCTELVSE